MLGWLEWLVGSTMVFLFAGLPRVVAWHTERRATATALARLEQHDGWYTPDAAMYRYFTSQPAPRRWSFVQQLAVDAQSPSLVAWLIAIGGLVVGGLTNNTFLLVAGAACAGIIAMGMRTVLDGRTNARIVHVRTSRLESPSWYTTARAYVRVDGEEIAVGVPWRPARALIDAHGSVELLVATTGKDGTAIALRAPDGAASKPASSSLA